MPWRVLPEQQNGCCRGGPEWQVEVHIWQTKGPAAVRGSGQSTFTFTEGNGVTAVTSVGHFGVFVWGQDFPLFKLP